MPDENERKVSLRKSLQQPINMTTTLMIEEAPRDTIVLNVSDLDKNASASTETMGLCLLHMNVLLDKGDHQIISSWTNQLDTVHPTSLEITRSNITFLGKGKDITTILG